MLQAGRLNVAQCHLKTSKWIEARAVCDKAIEEDNNSAKAWFRRGEAHLALNDSESAKGDFEKCVVLEPENKVRKNTFLAVKRSSTRAVVPESVRLSVRGQN